MTISTLISASLLCGLSCLSLALDVYPGEDVMLPCSNFSTMPTTAFWFRVLCGTRTRCISSMYGHASGPTLCAEAPKNKYEVSSNVSTVFLKVKRVDVSDSGPYFCGIYLPTQVHTQMFHLKINGHSEDATGYSDCPIKFKSFSGHSENATGNKTGEKELARGHEGGGVGAYVLFGVGTMFTVVTVVLWVIMITRWKDAKTNSEDEQLSFRPNVLMRRFDQSEVETCVSYTTGVKKRETKQP